MVFLKPNEKFELVLYNYLRLQSVLTDTYFVFCFQGITRLEDQLDNLNNRCIYIRQLNIIPDTHLVQYPVLASEMIYYFQISAASQK